MSGSTKPLISRGGNLRDTITRHWKWLTGLTVILVIAAAAIIGAYAWLGNTQHKSDELSDQVDRGIGRIWREQKEIKRDLAELTNTVGVLSQTVQQLSEQVEGYVTAAQLNATFYSINQTVLSINNTVSSIQEDVDTLSGEVVDLGTTVTQLGDDVVVLNETVLAVNSTVVYIDSTFFNPAFNYGEASGQPRDEMDNTQWSFTTGLSVDQQIFPHNIQIPISFDADGQLQLLTVGGNTYQVFCPKEDGVYEFTVGMTNISMSIDVFVVATTTAPYPNAGTEVTMGFVQVDPANPADSPLFYQGAFPLPPLATTVLPPPLDNIVTTTDGATLNLYSVLSIGGSGSVELASTIDPSTQACYKLIVVFADNYIPSPAGVTITYGFNEPTFTPFTDSIAYLNVRRIL